MGRLSNHIFAQGNPSAARSSSRNSSILDGWDNACFVAVGKDFRVNSRSENADHAARDNVAMSVAAEFGKFADDELRCAGFLEVEFDAHSDLDATPCFAVR
jgi:hypothetical protein